MDKQNVVVIRDSDEDSDMEKKVKFFNIELYIIYLSGLTVLFLFGKDFCVLSNAKIL